MSTNYGEKSLQAGVPTSYNVSANIGWAVIQNESPYTLSLEIQGTGSTRSIPAQCVDKISIPALGFNGNLVFTPVAILTNASQAPSFACVLEAFGREEEPTGTYPIALSRSVQIGGNVVAENVLATQLISHDQAFQTQIISARVAGDLADCLQAYNNGLLIVGSSTRQGQIFLENNGYVAFVRADNDQYLMENNTASGENRLQIDAGNAVKKMQLGAPSGNPNTIIFDWANGIISVAGATLNAGVLALGTVGTAYNGTGAGSGTVTIYQDLGGSVKRALLFQNNFKNAGAALNVPLPVPFTTFCQWRVTDNSGWSLLKSGVAQTLRPVGASNGAPGTTVTTFLTGWNYGDCLSGVDTVQYAGAGSAVHNGVLELVGV